MLKKCQFYATHGVAYQVIYSDDPRMWVVMTVGGRPVAVHTADGGEYPPPVNPSLQEVLDGARRAVEKGEGKEIGTPELWSELWSVFMTTLGLVL